MDEAKFANTVMTANDMLKIQTQFDMSKTKTYRAKSKAANESSYEKALKA